MTFTNKSKEDFNILTIEISNKKFDFLNLKSGETSKSIEVEEIYPYCYAKAITKIDTLIFVPIDYSGEKLKKRGKLNMKIYIDTITNKKRVLNFATEKD